MRKGYNIIRYIEKWAHRTINLLHTYSMKEKSLEILKEI